MKRKRPEFTLLSPKHLYQSELTSVPPGTWDDWSSGATGINDFFEIEEMIDPRDTRRLICEWVENAYRIASQPGKLAPRALQFRP